MFRLNSDVFPEEYDKDGDGKVYIVGQGESVKYLDEQEYLEWKKQIFWMPEMKIESCELGENFKMNMAMTLYRLVQTII